VAHNESEYQSWADQPTGKHPDPSAIGSQATGEGHVEKKPESPQGPNVKTGPDVGESHIADPHPGKNYPSTPVMKPVEPDRAPMTQEGPAVPFGTPEKAPYRTPKGAPSVSIPEKTPGYHFETPPPKIMGPGFAK
jgi:hypothetical protein